MFNPSRRSNVHGITSFSIAVAYDLLYPPSFLFYAVREMEMITRKRSKRISEQSSRHDETEGDEEEAEDDRIGEEGASRADEDDEEAQEQPLLSDEGNDYSVEEAHTVSQLLATTKSKYVIDVVRLTKIGFPG